MFEALHDAVEQALRRRWRDLSVAPLVTLAGGRSRVTLAAELHRAEVGAVVVKAAPEGRPAVGRHDMARQARVLRSLAAVDGVVVPEVLAEETAPVAFFVTPRVPGEAVEPVLESAQVELAPEMVQQRAFLPADMLAALHQTAVIPPPPGQTAEPVSDLRAEVERWRVTAEAADSSVLPGGAYLAGVLERTVPAQDTTAVLVHGDYRLGNIVFDGARPTGLIDWEIWGRTHPGVDLGWFLVFCDADLFPGLGVRAVGLPSGPQLLDRYWSAGGCRFSNVQWFEAFGRFKMAAIMAHNLRRHREGRHVDPFQEKLPPTIERLVATGIDKLGDD
jgi:aminoglycoside phosphotransferase (APT) family kinase protein